MAYVNPATPLHIAQQAQRMGRESRGIDTLAFNRIALITMGVCAAASVLTALHPIVKDLLRTKDDSQAYRRR